MSGAAAGGPAVRRRAVGTVAEALAAAGDAAGAPLLIIGRCPGEDHARAIRAGVAVSVSCIPELVTVAAAGVRAATPAPVHLEIDTGVDPRAREAWSALVAVARRFSRAGRIEVCGVWSQAGERGSLTGEERECLDRAVRQARRIGLFRSEAGPAAAIAA